MKKGLIGLGVVVLIALVIVIGWGREPALSMQMGNAMDRMHQGSQYAPGRVGELTSFLDEQELDRIYDYAVDERAGTVCAKLYQLDLETATWTQVAQVFYPVTETTGQLAVGYTPRMELKLAVTDESGMRVRSAFAPRVEGDYQYFIKIVEWVDASKVIDIVYGEEIPVTMEYFTNEDPDGEAFPGDFLKPEELCKAGVINARAVTVVFLTSEETP